MNLSIGALAQATGVPANTLRTWERRYGFPVAARTAGGQRVYAPEMVEHVRWVVRALDLGHRPAHVLTAPLDELRTLVGEGARSPTEPRPPGPPFPTSVPRAEGRADGPGRAEAAERAEPWVALMRRLDGDGLESALTTECARLGLRAFVTEFVPGFLRAVGDAWAEGRIAPFQEHFASERLREMLARQWRPLADRNGGPVGLCAGLPGEHHVLGLHLVACTLALSGWRVIFLGGDTPVPDLAAAAAQGSAAAIFVSVSEAAEPEVARAQLESLRARLAPGALLVVGGRGAPSGLPGVDHPGSLDTLASWLESAARPGPRAR